MSSVDENNYSVRRRSPRYHIERVLPVAGIGNDEFATIGRKGSVGGGDCDALLLLRGWTFQKPTDQSAHTLAGAAADNEPKESFMVHD